MLVNNAKFTISGLWNVYIYVLIGVLEHVFSPYIGNFIIPTDELIFFRGVGSTTNQMLLELEIGDKNI